MQKESESLSTQSEINKLIKSITALSNLVAIYLTITWGYAGLAFLIRSLY
jgi:hypothetical protein